jgi:hypothetical protein
MKGAMLTIRPDRGAECVPLDRCPNLHELKERIGGGFLEVVPWFRSIEIKGELHRCAVFVDEDGKHKGLTPNIFATYLWNLELIRQGRKAQVGEDYLAGPVCIVVGDDELLEEL